MKRPMRLGVLLVALVLAPGISIAKKPPPPAPAAPPPSVALGVEKWRAGDYPAAVAIWAPFADANDPDALFDMGQAYKLGRGVPVDLAKARDYYRRAATLGSRPALANLGIMLFQAGEKPEAVQWLAKAADRGEPRAQYVLGVAAYNGDGVRRNTALGYAYVALAARGGVPQAATTLSTITPALNWQDRTNGDAIAASIASGAGVPPQFALSTSPRLITAPPPPASTYSRSDVLKPPPAPVTITQPAPAPASPAARPPATTYAYAPPLPRPVPNPAPIVTPSPPAPAPMAVTPRPTPPPPQIAVAPKSAPPPPQITSASAPPPPVPIVTTPPVAPPPPVVRTAPVPASAPAPADVAADAPPPKPAPKLSEKPVEKPATKSADKPAEKAAPAGWRIQLGAYSTRAKADTVWDGIKSAQKGAIGSAKPVFESAGGIVKLQIGPYPSRDAAHAACEKLSAAGAACFPVAPH